MVLAKRVGKWKHLNKAKAAVYYINQISKYVVAINDLYLLLYIISFHIKI